MKPKTEQNLSSEMRQDSQILILCSDEKTAGLLIDVLNLNGLKAHGVKNVNGLKEAIYHSDDYRLLLIEMEPGETNEKNIMEHRETARRLGIEKVVFIIYATAGQSIVDFLKERRIPFLIKPFNTAQLCDVVRQHL